MTRALLAAAALAAAMAAPAGARPVYFENLRSIFAIPPGSRIDACGVCHRLWTGTGARNAFGTAVEQQLYTGKSIVDSLYAVEGDDTDGDGFTNLEELVTYLTLPGYDCDTFDDAIGAPLDYHTYITPFVDTCLPPLDIRPTPSLLSFLTQAGRDEVQEVTILNYGATTPLHVDSIAFAPGAPATLSVDGPSAPLDLAPGESIVLAVTFTPTSTALVSTALRIVSNDPETPTLDVPISGIGFVKNLAAPDVRAACREQIDTAYRKYSRSVLDAWIACGTDESRGVVCRRGKRDRAVTLAEDKLRRAVGGDKDRACAGTSLSPARIDYPAVCGGECSHLLVTSMPGLAECLVCRHEAVVARSLRALVGATPPDLPASTAADEGAAKCITRTGKGFARAADDVHRAHAACALDTVTAPEPPDCGAETAEEVAAASARVDETFAGCAGTAGLTACPLVGEEPDPLCLGSEAAALGADLADAAYDTAD